MKYKKSAVILVFNQEGELALQLRAAHDDSYPSHWDFSAAGGIDNGEDPLEAAHRELKEEIGIEGELEFLGEELYQDEVAQDRLFVYKTTYDGVFEIDPREVAEVKFFSLEQIDTMLASGEKIHPEFSMLWNQGVIKMRVKKV